MRKRVARNLKKDDGINYKKLFFELMIVLSVVFVVVLAILYPILKEHGAFEDNSYDKFKEEIVSVVDDYDYSNGRNLELEKELDEGFSTAFSATKKYFYGVARMTYYCNVGFFKTANDTYDILQDYLLPEREEQFDLEARKVVCERLENEANK